jgi:eukaryotic-like serine/threonine-protein kinase
VPESDPNPGMVIDGKYRLDALLGAGGMGTVYRATQLALNRPIAVKLIRGDAATADSDQRFEREALIVANLRHPNIVTIHDFGSAPSVGLYLVMEYLEGCSLRDELRRRGRIPIPETFSLIEPVCRALDDAHRTGVVHRDLKPDNIFLARLGDDVSVKVLDFGLAKLLAGGPHANLTATGMIAGTVAYMSPEQCRGEDVDARSDITRSRACSTR